MHCNLYQVSHKPISKDGYYDEWRYYGDGECSGFCANISDGITELSDDLDIEAALELLEIALKGSAIRSGHKFTITDKRKYFEKKYERFKWMIEIASDMSLDQYAGLENICGYFYEASSLQKENITQFEYLLSQSIELKYDIYVDDDTYQTLDEYMRYLKDGDSFYVGACFDYHI